MTDLNDIQLPPSLIADLFRSSLVSIGEESANVQPIFPDAVKKTGPVPELLHDKDGWQWQGGNKKNILLIVNNDRSVHLEENEYDFLSGMLKACQLLMEDVALVNMNNHPEATAAELTRHFNSRVVILFGYDPLRFGLPMSFPTFQIQPFSGSSYLYGPSLQELQTDKVLKSKLWVCLRRLFNI